jgi:hypothetical protein
MLNIRKSDPTFTNFMPTTAAEAVDRYVRCRNNGLKPMLIPECLIACARGLRGKELDMFETWIINPSGDLDNVELVEQTQIREANDAIFQANLRRVEESMQLDEEPPLPAESDDEKMVALSDMSIDDEKMVAPSKC